MIEIAGVGSLEKPMRWALVSRLDEDVARGLNR